MHTVITSPDTSIISLRFSSYAGQALPTAATKENFYCQTGTRWAQSVATGSQDFVESVKQELGFLARGRQGVNAGGSCHELKETQSLYGNQPHPGKDTNTLKWDVLLQKEWQPSEGARLGLKKYNLRPETGQNLDLSLEFTNSCLGATPKD